jgi:hypothetical protein
MSACTALDQNLEALRIGQLFNVAGRVESATFEKTHRRASYAVSFTFLAQVVTSTRDPAEIAKLAIKRLRLP